jgi:hypothetical protein
MEIQQFICFVVFIFKENYVYYVKHGWKIVTMCKLKLKNLRFKQKIMLCLQSLLVSHVRWHILLKF